MTSLEVLDTALISIILSSGLWQGKLTHKKIDELKRDVLRETNYAVEIGISRVKADLEKAIRDLADRVTLIERN